MIRTKIRAGLLTRDACGKGWYARGHGQACAACELVIDGTEVECEVRFADGTTLRFHRPCYAIWNDERADPPLNGNGRHEVDDTERVHRIERRVT
jgi:hypothetical protein